MKNFHFKIGDQYLGIEIDFDNQKIVSVEGLDEPTAEQESILAAVAALALMEHEVEVVHDDEPGVITLKPRVTAWNSPALALAAAQKQ